MPDPTTEPWDSDTLHEALDRMDPGVSVDELRDGIYQNAVISLHRPSNTITILIRVDGMCCPEHAKLLVGAFGKILGDFHGDGTTLSDDGHQPPPSEVN